MSELNNTRKSVRPGSDGFALVPAEISCVFKFGKDQPNFIFDDFNEFELSENNDNLTLNSAAAFAAIHRIKNQLKLSSSSLQVHSSDGSLISVFNTESQPSPSSTNYTQLETSYDLPVGDTSLIEQLLNQIQPQSFSDLDFEKELFDDLLPDDLDFDPNMTLDPALNVDIPVTNDSSHVYIEPNETSSSYLADSMMFDETTTSSNISYNTEESETQPIHRRKSTKRKANAESETSTERKLARFGNKQVVKYSNEYHDRRLKNNEAVKKSRLKAKEKQKSSESQMSQLTEENRRLNDRVEMLTKELQVLRSLYKDLKRDSVATTRTSTNRV